MWAAGNRKGVKYLIQAFAHLQAREPNIRLQIAGAGPDREKLSRKHANWCQHVEFLGYIDDATKVRLLHGSRPVLRTIGFGESFGVCC